MKKTLSIVMTVAIVIVMLFSVSGVAFAADNTTWSANCTPSTLSSAGTVKFTAKVTANGDAIKNAQVTYPDGTVYDLGDVASGSSQTHTNSSFAISESQLGQPMSFKFSYVSSSGNTVVKNGTVTINKGSSSTGELKITGNAKCDKSSVEEGSKAKFTFVFKNEGSVAIEDAALYAPDLEGGSQIGSDFDLEPGETKTMEWSVTVTKALSVTPRLEFTANGADKTLTLNEIKVAVGEDKDASSEGSMSATLSADSTTPTDGKVSFTATVKNDGDSEISGLKGTLSDGTAVSFSQSSIAAGESATAKFDVSTTGGSYTLSVTGTDESGNTVTAQSSAVTIEGSGEKGELKIEVKEDTNVLEKAGQVNFTITVSNTSDVVLDDVTISEATLGEIENIGSLGTDSKEITKAVDVAQTTDYNFTVTAKLADGSTITAAAPTITVQIADSGFKLDFFTIIMIIIAAAIVVVVILIVVLSRKHKKEAAEGLKAVSRKPSREREYEREQQQRAAAQRQRARAAQQQAQQTSAPKQTRSRVRVEEAPVRKKTMKAQNIDPKPEGRSRRYSDRNKF